MVNILPIFRHVTFLGIYFFSFITYCDYKFWWRGMFLYACLTIESISLFGLSVLPPYFHIEWFWQVNFYQSPRLQQQKLKVLLLLLFIRSLGCFFSFGHCFLGGLWLFSTNNLRSCTHPVQVARVADKH